MEEGNHWSVVLYPGVAQHAGDLLSGARQRGNLSVITDHGSQIIPKKQYLPIMNIGAAMIMSLTLCCMMARAQSIVLINSSFEGLPADATVPQGWMPCKEGTTPDILPGYWGVYKEAAEGATYVGLITRENNTWEVIGQRLPEALKKGDCYAWSLDLAHSDTYSGYNGALRLRIWLSSSKCGRDQLIYESPLIAHTAWETYRVKFQPNLDYQYIMLEAYHPDDPVHYQGNILIDHLRPIQGCDRT